MKRKRGHSKGSISVAATDTTKHNGDYSSTDMVEEEEQDSEVEPNINPNGSVERMTGKSMGRVQVKFNISKALSSAHDFHDYFPEPPRWKYDVFLSFQGEGPSGTRSNFTNVLDNALRGKGVVTFKDDKDLGKGRFIGDDLTMAIEHSALFLVVFSRDYASSKWCLDELSKIMECSRMRGTSSSSSSSEAFVFPIFHDVEPKDVRILKGSFGESFLRHEQDDTVGTEKILKWKSAMRDAGNCSGWDTRRKNWTEIADEIAKYIFDRTNHHSLNLPKDLVGLDSRVQEIMIHLNTDSVCFFGIWGMGGIGKTTLADAVHKRIRHCFEASVFLSNIRETTSKDGLLYLQKQLLSKLLMEENISLDTESDGAELIQKRLSHKKVLIILDDIDDMKQLKALAASSNWFGMRSKVIITTRDDRLLNLHGAITYELEELNRGDALKLFCRKAFNSDSPPEGYAELSYHFIDHANGLPLALEVLGSSLTKRTRPEWESVLSRLAKSPEETVTRTLRISFDGLKEMERKIFLHIACFFKGQDKSQVLDILSSCFDVGLNDIISILKEKSLIREISKKTLVGEISEKLWMHDLIQEMGWEVVRQESPDNPGKRSLLWHPGDIYNVLKYNKGTDFIRGLVLKSCMTTPRPLSAKAFSQMTKLRLLMLHDIPFCDNLTDLSNELRYIEWRGFPFEVLPTNFEAEDLVELNLPNSHLKELWLGTKHLWHLKTIDLSYSKSLTKTPDFTGTPNLEKIILEGCLQLQEVDKSIGILAKLIMLNLKDSEQLKVLPDSICNLVSLRFLDLSGCSSLIALPQNFGSLKCLEELKAGKKPKKQSSNSWLSYFSFLAPVSSRNSRWLHVPPLSGLPSLTKLELSFSNISDRAILDIGHLYSLRKLNLAGNGFVELPLSFTQLTKLEELNLRHCKRLRNLPTLPLSVHTVFADDCRSLQLSPNQLTLLASKFRLSFTNCGNLSGNCGLSDFANMLSENYLDFLRTDGISKFICVPGNSIPRCISNRSNGHFVSIDLPESEHRGTWIGFIMCCVFVLSKHEIAGRDLQHHISCCVRGLNFTVLLALPCGENCWRSESSDDIILLFPVSCKGYSLLWIPDTVKRITFSFDGSRGVIIKCCGVDLVFEQQASPKRACQITQLS